MVNVAPGGVGLPNLDEAVSHRTAVTVEHAAVHDDALSERFVLVLAGQVAVQLPYRLAPVGGTCGVRERLWQDDQGLLGCPEARRHIVRIQVRRLPVILRA
jgi:hypothetical protein